MKYILLSIALFISLQTYSQRFDGGFLGGFTASQIDGDNAAGFHKGGVVVGFFAETELSKSLRLMGEVEYYQKGATISSIDNTRYGKRALHYVEVPISVIYDYAKKIGIHAGVAPSYFFSGKQEGTIYDNKNIDFYKTFDIGWLAGVSYQLNDQFALRLRYTYSLFTISKRKVSGDSYSWIARSLGYTKGDYNNSLQLSVMYTLR